MSEHLSLTELTSITSNLLACYFRMFRSYFFILQRIARRMSSIKHADHVIPVGLRGLHFNVFILDFL